MRSFGSFSLVLLAAALLAGSSGCSRDATHAAGTSSFDFVDVAAELGIRVVNRSGDARRWYIPESNGSGAAWIDYDSDGDSDLFVGNGAGLVYHDDGARLEVVRDASSKLYANETNDGELAFRDVTQAAGALRSDWINGVATGDVEGDGDPDLYLACFGDDAFLRNDGGRFAAGTKAAGLANELWGAAATFGDADNDGDLDLYVANYCLFDVDAPPLGGKRNVIEGVEVGWGPEEENKQGANAGAPDRFFLNDGRGGFVEASARAGLALDKALCSYAAVFSDLDGDGWQDLLVANDLQPSNLFHNVSADADERPRFVEEGEARGFAWSGDGKPTGGMGVATADFDGDGDIDVFRTNFDLEANGLYVNDGSGHFQERAERHGLAQPGMDRLGWACAFFDAELDGDLDLLVANGHVYPQAAQIGMSPWLQQSQLFEALRRDDGDVRYVDATARAGSGLALWRSARGAALGDPDGDGDLDVVLVDVDAPPRFLRNDSRHRGHWVAVRTVGTASNRDGYGALVRVHAGGRTFVQEMKTTQGLYSGNEPRLHFGLGEVDAIDSVEVRWPSGRVSRLDDVPLDSLVTITEPTKELTR